MPLRSPRCSSISPVRSMASSTVLHNQARGRGKYTFLTFREKPLRAILWLAAKKAVTEPEMFYTSCTGHPPFQVDASLPPWSSSLEKPVNVYLSRDPLWNYDSKRTLFLAVIYKKEGFQWEKLRIPSTFHHATHALGFTKARSCARVSCYFPLFCHVYFSQPVPYNEPVSPIFYSWVICSVPLIVSKKHKPRFLK